MAKTVGELTFDAAVAHHRAGRFAEAEQAYRKLLAEQPNNPNAIHMLGMLAAQVGRADVAIDLIQRAIAINPNAAEFHGNLGNALRERGRIDDAIAAYRRAIALRPTFADPYGNLGTALRDRGLLEEAIDAFRRAIALQPKFVEAHSNLGNALRDKGLLDEATKSYRQSLLLQPNLAEVHNNLGNVLKDKGEIGAAIASYREALRLKPGHVKAHSNLVFTLPYHRDYSAEAILEENLRWDRNHAAALRPGIAAHKNDPNPARRLKIGYISPDFRDHCQSLFTVPLLSNHDRSQYEIFCYADIRRPDVLTERIQKLADAWRSTTGIGDQQVAEMIRGDRIDILIDLTMHMSNGRPLVLARKPAPVQIAWLAYPGTTGLAAMDFRLTDPYLDPPGMGDAFYSERSIRLPDTFWCYDPLTAEPVPNVLPATTNGYVTFGSLNNFCKVSEHTLSLWAAVLGAVAGSKMLVLASEGDHRARMLDRLRERGVEASRIEFIAYQPRRKYLEVYHRIDLGLDTFPVNGHTTSLDSFWMGIPVVTRVGNLVLGRAGWSQLNNLDLRELAGETDEDYVGIAVELAGDLERLGALRASLRQRMGASPLMDGPRFARNMETVYRDVWTQWCGAIIQ